MGETETVHGRWRGHRRAVLAGPRVDEGDSGPVRHGAERGGLLGALGGGV